MVEEPTAYLVDDTAADNELGAAMEKRKSAYMRFGKRKSAYMRYGIKFGDIVYGILYSTYPNHYGIDDTVSGIP